LWTREKGGTIFRDFVATSFIYGPLSNRWLLQYGVLQQCVELVMTSGVAKISEWDWGLAGSEGGKEPPAAGGHWVSGGFAAEDKGVWSGNGVLNPNFRPFSFELRKN